MKSKFPSVTQTGCEPGTVVTGINRPLNLGLVAILHDGVEPGADVYTGSLTITRVGNAIKKISELNRLKGVKTLFDELPSNDQKEAIFDLAALTKKSNIRGCNKRFDVGDVVYFQASRTSSVLNNGETYKALVDKIEKYPDDDEGNPEEAFYKLIILGPNGLPNANPPSTTYKLDYQLRKM